MSLSMILGVVVAVMLLATVVILAVLVLSARASGAMGYTRGHGHCHNMGACDKCDICEED